MQKTKLQLQKEIETLTKFYNERHKIEKNHIGIIKQLHKEKDEALKTILDNKVSFNGTIRKYNKVVDELRADEITYKFTIATLQSTIAKMVK